MGAGLQDPRHLRRHPADPEADHRPPRPRPDFQRAKIKTLENGITPNELKNLIEEKCRKVNGKINFTELSRHLGCDPKTAKARCTAYNIS